MPDNSYDRIQTQYQTVPVVANAGLAHTSKALNMIKVLQLMLFKFIFKGNLNTPFSRLFQLFKKQCSQIGIYLIVIQNHTKERYKLNKKRIIKKALPVLQLFKILFNFLNNRFPWKRDRNEAGLDKFFSKRDLTVNRKKLKQL